MVGKGKKGKGKNSQTKPKSIQGGKKKELSKIKCFNCHEFRHYATECLLKKFSKKNLGRVVREAFASQLKPDFTLITCMDNNVMGSVWYLDSGASFHMTGCREFLSDLEEKDLQMHIEFGDNKRYNDTRIGTIAFKRESGSPLHLKYFTFVPGLKKNLIFFAVLEDHGYDVIFSKGKTFLKHVATGKVKHIGVTVIFFIS